MPKGDHMPRRYTYFALSAVAVLTMNTSAIVAMESAPTTAEGRARTFVAQHEANVRPLEIAVNLAWWRANTTGKEEDFAAKELAQNQLDKALSDRNRFAELKT